MRLKKIFVVVFPVLIFCSGVKVSAAAATVSTAISNTVQSLELKVTADLALTNAGVLTAFDVDGISDVTDTNTPRRKLFRILGGVRVKLEFDDSTLTAQEQADVPAYKWVLGAAGRTCTSFTEVDNDTNCTTRSSTDEIENVTKIWWEPSNWDLGLNTGANAKLEISFDTPLTNKKKTISFRVENRTLQAVTSPGKLMKGSDVKMLEQVLWQLGRSPHSSLSGESANNSRISKKDEFSIKAGASISMEQFVSRFKQQLADPNTSVIESGTLDQLALNNLEAQWKDYFVAYSGFQATGDSRINNLSHSTDFDTWITEGIKELQYQGLTQSNPRYTLAIHRTITGDATDALAEASMKSLLNSWVEKEASFGHWGHVTNSKNEPYRMVVGSGDTHGSIGFSQVQPRYVYDGGDCEQNKMSDINLYDPQGAVKGIGRYLTSHTCGSSFRSAFLISSTGQVQDYMQTYSSEITGFPKITGFEQGVSGTGTKTAYVEADNFERLNKGMMGYKEGRGRPEGMSWPKFLKDFTRPANPGVAVWQIRGINYPLTIKKAAGLPLRTYHWQDQYTEPDPASTTGGTRTVDFCFKFGESEWLLNQSWNSARSSAETQSKAGTGATCPI